MLRAFPVRVAVAPAPAPMVSTLPTSQIGVPPLGPWVTAGFEVVAAESITTDCAAGPVPGAVTVGRILDQLAVGRERIGARIEVLVRPTELIVGLPLGVGQVVLAGQNTGDATNVVIAVAAREAADAIRLAVEQS